MIGPLFVAVGRDSQTRGWPPPAAARSGPLPLVLERCRYVCVCDAGCVHVKIGDTHRKRLSCV